MLHPVDDSENIHIRLITGNKWGLVIGILAIGAIAGTLILKKD